MPQITVKQTFKFAHHGYQVEEFEASDEPRETTAECAELAIAQGWAVEPDTKSRGAAPENKDAAPQRSKKAAT